MNERLFGNTIKEIRIGKGLSQSFVVENTISQSNYSRFENGEIEISARAFINILNKMEVSFEEFLLFHQQEKANPRDSIKKMFYKLTYNEENELEEIIKKIDIYDPDNVDLNIRLIRKVCSSLLILLKESNINKAREGLNEVWQLLSKRNQLFSTDIYLLNSILFYFPLETVRTIKEFLDRNIKFYKGKREMEMVQLSISLNFSLLLIKDKEYSEALEYIEESIKKSKQLRDILRIGVCYVRKGIVLSSISDEKNSCYWIEKGLSLIKEIKEYEIIEILEEEIKNYKIK